ncbi:MAG TPA: transcriptional regulator NrdR [Holophaga sp.]|nr:transcriptional regulator NrdR [Holophaga sp.]
MRCPFCGHLEDKVVDSRESREGEAIRRRRECLKCGRRFTSYERLEELPILIAKKDGRREPFDRQKLLRGVMAACQKRPVSLSRLEELVGDIQARLMEHPDREIPSLQLGELVMDALKGIDSVAYVRFASVYRDFKDLPDFVRALEGLMGGQPPALAHAQRKSAPAKPINHPAQDPPPPPQREDPHDSNPPQPTPLFPGLAPEAPIASGHRKTKRP